MWHSPSPSWNRSEESEARSCTKCGTIVLEFLNGNSKTFPKYWPCSEFGCDIVNLASHYRSTGMKICSHVLKVRYFCLTSSATVFTFQQAGLYCGFWRTTMLSTSTTLLDGISNLPCTLIAQSWHANIPRNGCKGSGFKNWQFFWRFLRLLSWTCDVSIYIYDLYFFMLP